MSKGVKYKTMVNYNINLNDYKIISTLGQCLEGKAAVHLAKHVPSGSMVALKKFNMDKIKDNSYLVDVRYYIHYHNFFLLHPIVKLLIFNNFLA